MRIPSFKIIKKEIIKKTTKTFFWFSVGSILGLFLFISFAFIIFQKINSDVVYPGISVDNIDLSGKTEKEVIDIFENKNIRINNTQFVFSNDMDIATISAKELDFGYDQNLIARQTMDIGRSSNFLSNISLILASYIGGLKLTPAYLYSEEKLSTLLFPFIEKVNKEAVNAQFSFQNGKVITFKASEDGRKIDLEKIKESIKSKFTTVINNPVSETIHIPVPIKIVEPKITTDKANSLGIKELIGSGTSFFYHSIPGRIFNINLAASRINGVLVAPNEEFSFNKALGDVSAFTGYKQAYIIQNGKTILGDGGGVCQVSTTFFRAILDSGLPVLERHAHAYRVSYYETDSAPGIDATIYVPTVDLKFKNDTGNYILIQTQIDEEEQKLLVFLYGTKDGRQVQMTTPVVTNRRPAPEDLYQDDPALPKGVVKQVDFKAEGATVQFTRKVFKNGQEIISDKFVSNYSPWQSIFLRGTKEN